MRTVALMLFRLLDHQRYASKVCRPRASPAQYLPAPMWSGVVCLFRRRPAGPAPYPSTGVFPR
jgi:hypothetical protein